MDINSVNIIGRLTKDPEIKILTTGSKVANLSIAVNDYSKSGENPVYYFNIEVWNKAAENCATYLKKGSQVAISGKLKQDRWNDESGQMHSRVKITGQQIQFIGKKFSDLSENQHEQETNLIKPLDDESSYYEANGSPISDDEVPF